MNTNMRFIALILICIGLQAQAEGLFFFDERLGIKDFKKMTVFVNINDWATGGALLTKCVCHCVT